MQQFGEDLLARAALALQQHRNGRLGNPFQLLADRSHQGRLPEDYLNRGQVAEIG
jgi:hypothetical protein